MTTGQNPTDESQSEWIMRVGSPGIVASMSSVIPNLSKDKQNGIERKAEDRWMCNLCQLAFFVIIVGKEYEVRCAECISSDDRIANLSLLRQAEIMYKNHSTCGDCGEICESHHLLADGHQGARLDLLNWIAHKWTTGHLDSLKRDAHLPIDQYLYQLATNHTEGRNAKCLRITACGTCHRLFHACIRGSEAPLHVLEYLTSRDWPILRPQDVPFNRAESRLERLVDAGFLDKVDFGFTTVYIDLSCDRLPDSVAEILENERLSATSGQLYFEDKQLVEGEVVSKVPFPGES